MNRDEMIEYLDEYCKGKDCKKCRLENYLDCEFEQYDTEQLKRAIHIIEKNFKEFTKEELFKALKCVKIGDDYYYDYYIHDLQETLDKLFDKE